MKVEYLNCCVNSSDRKKKDDIASTLESFQQSNKIQFTTLSDMPVSLLDHNQQNSPEQDIEMKNNIPEINHKCKPTITVSTTKLPNQDPNNTPISSYQDFLHIEDKAKLELIERKMNISDILFISIAWNVLPAFRLII